MRRKLEASLAVFREKEHYALSPAAKGCSMMSHLLAEQDSIHTVSRYRSYILNLLVTEEMFSI